MTSKEEGNALEWVNKYADYLYRYAFLRIRDEETARELVQDTFLTALEMLSSFKWMSSEKTWLTSILRHKISDEYHRKARIKPLRTETNGDDFFEENGFWKEAYQPKSFGLEADSALYNNEFESILEKCLKKLPSLWNAVVSLKYLDEEKTAEICSKLQITSSNYWVIIHRAKLNLRDCLQKNWMNA